MCGRKLYSRLCRSNFGRSLWGQWWRHIVENFIYNDIVLIDSKLDYELSEIASMYKRWQTLAVDSTVDRQVTLRPRAQKALCHFRHFAGAIGCRRQICDKCLTIHHGLCYVHPVKSHPRTPRWHADGSNCHFARLWIVLFSFACLK